MTLTGQLAQSAAAQSAFPLNDLFLTVDVSRAGMLANVSVQTVSYSSGTLRTSYYSHFRNTQAKARLAALKEQRFTPEGRHARIEASLRALNAPQPIDLPLRVWKSILEELEDED